MVANKELDDNSQVDYTSQVLAQFESKGINCLVREYLAGIQASIQLDYPCIPPLQRQGDSCVMDHILDFKGFHASEIQQLSQSTVDWIYTR